MGDKRKNQSTKCLNACRYSNRNLKGSNASTFEPVSSVEILASEDECEEEDGQQAQGANQHRAQIHICNANTKRHQGAGFVIGKKKNKRAEDGPGIQTVTCEPAPHAPAGPVLHRSVDWTEN